MSDPTDSVAQKRPPRQRRLPARSPRGPRRRRFASAVSVVLVVGLAACGGQSAAPSATGATRQRASAATAFTLIDGKSATLAAFRGHPALVWFVEDGCASCAASIPAVAQHLHTFARTHTRILVLGVYGTFGQGKPARTQLASFGRAAAGAAFSSPAWTWGIASAELTTTYDPGAVPDEYFLLDRAGRTVYHDSVPVSTMGALLAHLNTVRS